MRTIKLTHEEIEIIKTALGLTYGNIMRTVKEYSAAISEQARCEMINTAESYLEAESAFDGERDV